MALASCFATAAERRRPLRADGMIPDPLFTSTHAITIEAPPERVWPWIAQMGGGRAGWYSWDAIDNGGTPSATSILPALQTVAPGDVMPAVPGATDAFVVAAVEANRDLVLTAPDGQGGIAVAWEHFLQPLDDGRTRLIARAVASRHWLDLARMPPPDGRRRLFIERVYAFLARLPGPVLFAFASLGHRLMEARHLRGIRRRSADAADGARRDAWRKAMLLCGIASSLLYAAMIWTIRYEGYSVLSQVPSELTAIGAPTRGLWERLGWIYTVLVTVFGLGLWTSRGQGRTPRVVGALILAYASLGLLWPFAAMHDREVLAAGGGTFGDTLHVVLGGVTVALTFLTIGAGARAFGRRFRVYSIASIVVLLGFGALTFLEAPRLQANLPTPWIGLWERINISVFLLWVAVLATLLLRNGAARATRAAFHPAAFRSADGEARFTAAYDAVLKRWPVPYEEIDISTRFGTTHVVLAGPTDAPALVLLHGYMAASVMWAPNVAAFSRDHRVYAVRMPVLLLFGDREVIYDPARALSRARRLVTDLEGALVPDCAHDMCFSQHGIVDARVVEFLQRRIGRQPGTGRRAA
jgi:hypothetical protein